MSTILLAVTLTFGMAFANPHEKAADDSSCSNVKGACEKAGYKSNTNVDGKGLVMGCMNKLMNGEKVAGVAMEPGDAQVATCKDLMMVKKTEPAASSTKPVKSKK